MQAIDLKITRIRAGIKQWELASKMGINQNRLSQFELGRYPTTPEIEARIMRAIDEINQGKGNGLESGGPTGNSI